MKLQDKYNRTSLVTTGIIIILAGIAYFYIISSILTNQVDKDLLVEENEIFNYVRLNHRLPQVFNSTDLQIEFTSVGNQKVNRQFIHTSFYNKKEKEIEAGRGLISSVMVNGQRYRIRISESTVETEDLIQIIFLLTLVLIVLLMFALFIINRFTLKRLWQPFYQTLQQIKLFNLTEKNTFQEWPSQIDEFNELNVVVASMASRVRKDYQELKSFMENAAHELMTPIAVINSKLDTLIQTEDFNQRQSELLGDVYETVGRLTRLNKAMLLLTKIENKLIKDNQQFDAKESIEDALIQFQELFLNKDITLHTELNSKYLIMSKTLFEILLNNLLSNAIRHNYNGGRTYIKLNQSQLSVANTGKQEPLDPAQIFQRFNKSTESEGVGLGLTLSKQICENYNYAMSYYYKDDQHVFAVNFN